MALEAIPAVRAYNRQNDELTGIDEPLERSSLLDFWTWAFSDLCDDDIKGIFAGWLVLKLLGIPGTRRFSWANSDLVTPSGVGIEVKSSSYWQSWKLIDGFGKIRETPSHALPADAKISFHGLMARDSTTVSTVSDRRDFKSELYVFAFQHEKDWRCWNAMDLSQWEFYIVPVERLTHKSISLVKLRSEFSKLSATQFSLIAKALIAEIEERKAKTLENHA